MMKYHTIRMFLSVNLLAGCLLFQGCGLMRGSSDSDETAVIPGSDLGPVEVIDDDATSVTPEPVQTVTPPPPETVVPAEPLTTPYTIKKGDTISAIAYRYYLRWQDILAVNPGVNPKRLRIGQVIQLPGQVNLSKSRPVSKKTKKSVKRSTPAKITAPEVSESSYDGPTKTYIVKKGDSLSVIAYKHGIKTSALRAVNNLKSDRILIGQKLKLPVAAKSSAGKKTAEKSKKPSPPPAVEKKKPVETKPVQAAPAPEKEETEKVGEEADEEEATAEKANLQTYTVKEGEDVYAVAIRWGVSPKEISALNNLNSIELEPGTVLKIPSVK
ncbi:MAG: LysM peptidoglycan-binding domain-containing protein [Kiritimatiellia bacterium]